LKRFLAHATQRVGRGAAISTRRVAMCAHLLLTDMVTALGTVRSPNRRRQRRQPHAVGLPRVHVQIDAP
jgi:hypothetical protein